MRRGADIIRLDAVTYLWSEPGTECVHLPQTHSVVKLLRDVMDTAAPGVALVTETNVPHDQNITLQVRRYVASRSLAFVIKGVPGIYTHGALAIPNDHALVEETGVKRDVNRGVIDPDKLVAQLKDPRSKRALLRRILLKLALNRTRNRAFHPQGEQRTLTISPSVFSILRIAPEGGQRILALTNVTDRATQIAVSVEALGTRESLWRDLISGKEKRVEQRYLTVELWPYDVIWLTPDSQSQLIEELVDMS